MNEKQYKRDSSRRDDCEREVQRLTSEIFGNGKEGLRTSIARIEEKVKTLQSDVTTIRENHLEHIYHRLNSIDKKQAYYAGAIVVVVAIAQWIFSHIK